MSTLVIALMNGTGIEPLRCHSPKNQLESIYELLKKGDKYVDAREAKKVTKNNREGWELASYKRKSIDERKSINKNKLKNEHMNKGHTQDMKYERTRMVKSNSDVFRQNKSNKVLSFP